MMEKSTGAIPPVSVVEGAGLHKPTAPQGLWAIIAFGILLPLLALALELSTRACAGNLFDPFPTVWHGILFTMIAVSNALVLWSGKWQSPRSAGWLRVLHGLGLGVAIWYTLQTLPIMPLALLAMAFALLYPPMFFYGLAALSPILALMLTIYNRRHLNVITLERKKRLFGLWAGIGLAVLLLGLLEAPGAFTEFSMQQVNASDARTSERALARLRVAGNRQTMLRRCYERPQTGAGFLSLLASGNDSLTTDASRTIYYRVTGQPFNSVPAPVNLDNRGSFFRGRPEDNDQGGDAVAGKIPDLSLHASRIDGSVDADAALAYLQWTLAFKNDSTTAQEARMQIALPPGAVVSRLTLWVDGEEREAAFAARGRVRQAYKEVAVVQQRDPVLVTTCGPDRVLVQCFPVPANGGTMRIRLGITAPLVLDTPDAGLLAMPRMIEQNFDTPVTLHSTMWMESKAPMNVLRMRTQANETSAGVFALRLELAQETLTESAPVLHCRRNPATTSAWTPDSLDPRHAVIRQQIVPQAATPLKQIILVIDGSRSMRESLPAIAGALNVLPPGSKFAVLLAADRVHTLAPLQTADPANCANAARQLREIRCDGGMDNVPALASAWDMIAEQPDSAILWIHGPQPLILESIDGLAQRWERRPAGPQLYAVEAVAGDNAPLRALDQVSAIHNVPRVGGLTDDLTRLFTTWNGTPRLCVIRERVKSASWQNRAGSKETSTHLSRLWAQSQARQYYAKHGAANTEMAIAIAQRYQLVTPVTGAVVLENKSQYDAAGLEPVPAGTVPTVPEPEVWILLLVASMIFGYGLWKRRSVCAVS